MRGDFIFQHVLIVEFCVSGLNESGHYRPSPELRIRAGLPEELFQPGQFI